MNGNQPHPANMAPQTVYIGFDQPVHVAAHPQAPYAHHGYQTRQNQVDPNQVENGVYFKEKKKPNTFGLLGFILGICGLATGAVPVALVGGAASTIGIFRKRRFMAITGLMMALFNPATHEFANQFVQPDRHTRHVAAQMMEQNLSDTNTVLAQAEDRVLSFYKDHQETWPDDIQGNMLVAELADAWGSSLRFDEMPDRLLLRSAGPDREAETQDDIVLALHHFRKTGETPAD